MPSPAKKRKLNTDAKGTSLPSRGLEYFFSKQRQNEVSKKPVAEAASSATEKASSSAARELTDEELARKLQAEWDQEESPQVHGEVEKAADGSRAYTGEIPELNNEDPSGAPQHQPPALAVKTANTLSLQSVTTAEDLISESLPLDESPLTFDPSQHIGRLHDHWKAEGGEASYAFLTRCFVLVNSTRSRIKIVDTLVNCLRILIEADPDSLLPAVCRLQPPLSFLSPLRPKTHAAAGLACHKCHQPAIHIARVGSRGFRIIQGAQEGVRLRRSRTENAVRQVWRPGRCCLRSEEEAELYPAEAETPHHHGCIPISSQNRQ